MTDTYQAIYDAVRSRISGGDIGSVVADEVRRALDISHVLPHLQQEIYTVSHELQRPSVLFKPMLSADGDMWCALLGADLQSGVAGFGKTPHEAMIEFDQAFYKQNTPTAVRLARGQQ